MRRRRRRRFDVDGVLVVLNNPHAMLPSLEPPFMCSRRRSPALRCTKPKSFTMLVHCVPLPAPKVLHVLRGVQRVCRG